MAVDPDDFMSGIEQAMDELPTDETAGSGHEHFHIDLPRAFSNQVESPDDSENT